MNTQHLWYNTIMETHPASKRPRRTPTGPNPYGRLLLFTTEEFAFLTFQKANTVMKAVQEGRIKGKKDKGIWLIPEAELIKFWGARYKKVGKSHGKEF